MTIAPLSPLAEQSYPLSNDPGKAGPQRFRPWMEALADFMIANPTAKNTELASHFGKSPAWMSTVVNSDAFRTYFRVRRSQLTENHDNAIKDKSAQVAVAALDSILSVIEKKKDTIPLRDLVAVQDSALKTLGYGAPPVAPSVAVNVNNDNRSVTVDAGTLRAAQQTIRSVEQERLSAREVPALSAEELAKEGS